MPEISLDIPRSSEISLDLPREHLIGWIGKQLAVGVRVGEGRVQFADLAKTLHHILETKKKIVKNSKLLSDKLASLSADEWRNAVASANVVLEKNKLALAQYERKRVAEGAFEISSGRVEVEADDEFADHLLSEWLARTVGSLSEINRVWTEVADKLSSDAVGRSEEQKLFMTEINSHGNGIFDSISNKRQLLMEQYLHERYLLKKLRDSRAELEKELRGRIAALSAQLHVSGDVGRVAAVAAEEHRQEKDEQQMMHERKREWRLMEEENRLVKSLQEIDGKANERLTRLHTQIQKCAQVQQIETSFILQKSECLRTFKGEVAMLRSTVRRIENSISKFRAYLREDEKARRATAKILRE